MFNFYWNICPTNNKKSHHKTINLHQTANSIYVLTKVISGVLNRNERKAH